MRLGRIPEAGYLRGIRQALQGGTGGGQLLLSSHDSSLALLRSVIRLQSLHRAHPQSDAQCLIRLSLSQCLHLYSATSLN